MPGFDGTGPMGMGPRTGGGFGFCPPVYGQGVGPVYGQGIGPVYGLGRGGIPWGGGRGRGFGGGRGRGFGFRRFGWGYPAPVWGTPYAGQMAPDQEKAMLEDQVSALSQQLEAMRGRINELEQQRSGAADT